MKTLLKQLYVSIFLVFLNLSLIASSPPPPPGQHGLNDNQCPTKGVPVGNGLIILIGLAAAYGGRILYTTHKKRTDKNLSI